MNPPHQKTADRPTTTTGSDAGATSRADLVCLSHLRWNFVFQRPQHLMTRFAAERRVFFIEEPIFDSSQPQLAITRDGNVRIVVPHLPPALAPNADAAVTTLIDGLIDDWAINRPVCWYYTPMALAHTRHIQAGAVVYDCMDELAAFKGAPPELLAFEDELFERA